MVRRRIKSVMMLLATLATAGVVLAAPALAACEDHFPDAQWRLVGETALLVASATPSVPDGAALRFADTGAATARVLEADFGSLPPLHLCVFSEEDRLDPSGLESASQQLHAAVFNDDGTVYVNTLQSSFFDESHAFGLAYATLWDVASRQGEVGFPEPLATTIGQWYLSRSAGKLELHHSQMRGGAFFRDPSGEGIETTDWTAARQAPALAWNPQFQESPMADLVQYAVERNGVEILQILDGERWAEIEQEWQAALRDEALQGASSGNDWIVGLAIFFGFIGLAGLTAFLTKRSRIRIREEARRRGEKEAGVTSPSVPGAAPATPHPE